MAAVGSMSRRRSPAQPAPELAERRAAGRVHPQQVLPGVAHDHALTGNRSDREAFACLERLLLRAWHRERVLRWIGYLPPAEYELNYHRRDNTPADVAGLN